MLLTKNNVKKWLVVESDANCIYGFKICICKKSIRELRQ